MITKKKKSSVLKRLRSLRSRRGYTVVEVISAMTLFAIGAAGVISMQRVTIQGGTDARRFDVGSNIANEWAHRFHRDSMLWTQPNAANPNSQNLFGGSAATRWLRDIATPNTWIRVPALTTGTEMGVSGAFDVYGRDLPASGAGIEHFYCTQYRLNWISDPGPALPPGGVIRVELRVIWARLDSTSIINCNDTTNFDPDTNPNSYHFVYVTTAVRENPN
jgi:prepilin-type N-terminal cleavage/methylation domain-containing protein